MSGTVGARDPVGCWLAVGVALGVLGDGDAVVAGGVHAATTSTAARSTTRRLIPSYTRQRGSGWPPPVGPADTAAARAAGARS